MSSPRVAVIGGGIAGLSAALRLEQIGADVSILEGTERVGGLLGTRYIDGAILEAAANGFLASAEDGAVDLADELGVPMLEADAAARRRWIYMGDSMCALPSSPVELLSTRMLSTAGKLRAVAEPLVGAVREDQSVFDFARRRLGREVAENLVAPFVTGVFAGDARKLSVRAAFPLLAELERDGGLARGLVKRKLGSGSKGKRRARIQAPERGVQALIEALASRLDERIRTAAKVAAIEPAGGSVSVVLEDGEAIDCDAVVLAVQARSASRLVADIDRQAATLLARIPYVSVVVAHMLYRREDVEHALDGFGFLVREGEPLPILGCVFESSLWPNRAPDGMVLLRCMLGGARDPAVIEAGDADIEERCRGALERSVGARGMPAAVHIVRWRDAIAQYTPGHLDRVDRIERALEPAGIALAGNSYRGISVNHCVASARDVARRIASLASAAGLSLMLVAAACSSSPARTAGPGDAGEDAAAPPAAESPESSSGVATLVVEWKEPPAELLRLGKSSGCSRPRPALLSVHAAGGVRDAVVTLDAAPLATASDQTASVRMSARPCRLEPRLVVRTPGQPLEIVSAADDPHPVVVKGEDGEAIGRLVLRVLGQRHRIADMPAGLVRIELPREGSEGSRAQGTGYVYTASDERAALTDGRGRVVFRDLPPGRYRARAIHPATGRSARATVEIEAGGRARAVLSLSSAEPGGRR